MGGIAMKKTRIATISSMSVKPLSSIWPRRYWPKARPKARPIAGVSADRKTRLTWNDLALEQHFLYLLIRRYLPHNAPGFRRHARLRGQKAKTV